MPKLLKRWESDNMQGSTVHKSDDSFKKSRSKKKTRSRVVRTRNGTYVKKETDD